MKEPFMSSEANPIAVDVMLEVYLKHKEESLKYVATFYFDSNHLDEDNLAESFMDMVVRTLVDTINDNTEPHIIMSDASYNKFLVNIDYIQAISMFAPSEETIRAKIIQKEGSNE
ncbi:MAG: hypothetical protein QXU32_02345 [Nitrososphaerales archaeon]